jgi:Putative metallopeptidase
MRGSMRAPKAFDVAIIGAFFAFSSLPAARAQAPAGTIADGDSVFIDGQALRITPGKARPNSAGELSALGGRDLGPGAIIYRRGERLYIVDGPASAERGGSRGPISPVVDPNRARPGQIRVQYDPPKNPEHLKLYQILMKHSVLEKVQEMLSPFRLPKTLVIKTLGCDGLINSWYNEDEGIPTVHMCYELLQNIIMTTTEQNVRPDVTRHDAITGQFLFWTLHETGHAVFDILQVPLFGREEDAADEFGAYLMLQFGKDQARRWIEGAVYSAEEFKMDFGPMDNYASVHGLPQQRFYNLLCLAYGADSATFADVTNAMTDKGYLPKRRADNCEYEYQTFKRSFRAVVSPYIDRQAARAVMDATWFPESAAPRITR